MQKFLGVLQLELEVVVVRVRSEPDFLHYHLLLLRFDFFLLLFLVVQELLVLNDAANGRICLGEISTKSNSISRAS